MKKRYIFIFIIMAFISLLFLRKKNWQECLVTDYEIVIKDEILDGYLIQGVCQAENYTLVSAYNIEVPLKNSIIMIYNEDGSLYNIIQLDDYTHAGSIAYYDGFIYISGLGLQNGDQGYQYISEKNPNEALIEVYSLDDFLNAAEYRQIITRKSTIYFGDPDQILFSSASTRGNSLFSFLTVEKINNEVCIVGGNYNLRLQAHLLIVPLTSIQDNGVINNEKIKIYDMPINRIQGICVMDDQTILLTQSDGNNESNLIQCTINESELTIFDSIKIPAHAEQVSKKDANTLMIAFEKSDESIRFFDYSKIPF